MSDFDRVANRLFANGGSRVGGARIVPPGRVGNPAHMVPAETPGGNPQEYSSEVYRNSGDSYFGLGAVNIPAGSTGTTFNVQPIRPFLPLEFRVKSTVTGLLIVQVDIEGTLFFANKSEPGNGMAVELLSEVATLGGIEWETINPSTGVSFTIANPTGTDLTFASAFQGIFLRK